MQDFLTVNENMVHNVQVPNLFKTGVYVLVPKCKFWKTMHVIGVPNNFIKISLCVLMFSQNNYLTATINNNQYNVNSPNIENLLNLYTQPKNNSNHVLGAHVGTRDLNPKHTIITYHWLFTKD